jgi:hypothetical protein
MRSRDPESRVSLAQNGLVFPSQVGTPLGGRNLIRHYKIRLKTADLPPLSASTIFATRAPRSYSIRAFTSSSFRSY